MNGLRSRVFGFIIGTIGTFLIYFHKWDDSVAGGGDPWGYYTYLPSTLLYGDLKSLSDVIELRKIRFPESVTLDEEGRESVREATNTEQGRVIKYTYGYALFYLPSFAISHAIASLISSFTADGYSLPYILGVYLMSVLYVLFGIILLWKFLSSHFKPSTVAWTTIIIALGTNLFYFMVLNNAMAHPLLFFLWSGVMYCSDRYWQKRRSPWFLLAMVGCAAISIIRPSEVICYLIPLLWSNEGFQKRFMFFKRNRQLLGYGLMIAILFLSPQLIYWKYTSGSWLFDSYPQESFDFSNPQIIRGIFGFQNGWLIYSPLMLFGLFGMFTLSKSGIKTKWIVPLVFSLHVLIIYSWWNWFYINGFGSRPMVSIYPLLALPIAAFIEFMRSKWGKIALGILTVLGIVLNIFQTWQHDRGILWTEYGNIGYYAQAFGRLDFSKKISMAIDLQEYQLDQKEILDTLLNIDFENDMIQNRSDQIKHGGSYGYRITDRTKEDLSPLEITYEEVFYNQESKPTHFVINLDIYVMEQITSFYDFDYLTLEYVRPDYSIYKRRYLRLNNKVGDENLSIWWGDPRIWDRIEGTIRISSRFKPGHRFRLFFDKKVPKSLVYVDNVSLYTARKK